MQLKEAYQPIKKELEAVEGVLASSLRESKNKSILRINNFLLSCPGKRLRPALVILSAKAGSGHKQGVAGGGLIKIASAIELIHMASLVHDDVIDHSKLRHNQPTIHSKWGEDVAIALGDYLYSKAFELIATSKNTDILSCISQATRLMCEGELIQVCERDNLQLLKERYIIIVKKKTANLFAASCQSGAIASGAREPVRGALREYGLNFGIAFQIIDDCLDLIAREEDLGKTPGADFKMGELTLPVLNLLSKSKDKNRILSLLKNPDSRAFEDLRQRFINSPAYLRTKDDVALYIHKAKNGLSSLNDSCFKQSLFILAEGLLKKIRP